MRGMRSMGKTLKQATENKLVYLALTIALTGFFAFVAMIIRSQTCIEGICSGGIL